MFEVGKGIGEVLLGDVLRIIVIQQVVTSDVGVEHERRVDETDNDSNLGADDLGEPMAAWLDAHDAANQLVPSGDHVVDEAEGSEKVEGAPAFALEEFKPRKSKNSKD